MLRPLTRLHPSLHPTPHYPPPLTTLHPSLHSTPHYAPPRRLEHLELPPIEVPKKNGGRSTVRVTLRETSVLDVSQLLRGPGDQPLKWTDARPLMQVLDNLPRHHLHRH